MFRVVRAVAALGAAGALVAAGTIGAVPAAAATDRSGVQRQLDRLTGPDGLPGALAQVRDRHGRTVTLTSGTAERGTHRRMVGADGRLRIASVTKTFVAVTVLRLAADHTIDLDAPLERYLPGVVRGTGAGAAIDGRAITVRQVLRQTSGLPEFSDAIDPTTCPCTPRQELSVALARTPTGRPGERWSYANTNYLVAGMVVTAATGQDFRTVSTDRVLRPLGLSASYWARPGELELRGPHAHFYGVDPLHPGGVVDVTRFPTYELGPSGGLVSTPADLNRFWPALFAGRVLPAAQFREMTTDLATVSGSDWPAGTGYGLGVARTPLPCGGQLWWHGGSDAGTTVFTGHDTAGRTVTVYANATAGPHTMDVVTTATTALCATH